MSHPSEMNVLLTTPLDFPARPNNSEHNRAEHYARLGCRVTVLYKRMNDSRRLRDMIRDSLTFRVQRPEEGNPRLVGVDPFFNYFGGYRIDAEARGGAAAGGNARLAVVRLLSPLAALRDLFYLPCFLLAARKTLRNERFDVCLGVGPWGGLVGWALRALGRVKVLVYVDRDYEAGLASDRIRRRYTEAIERFGIRRADVVVCVSRLLAERRRRHFDGAIHIIPNGVNWDGFDRSRQSPKGGSTLLYVGNVISWSGVEHAIAAMPSILRERPDATLRIVGGGLRAYIGSLEQRVRELGLEDRVEFLGERPREELGDLMADADIGLANSEPVAFRRYACPIKIIEYMAGGLPVIATEGTEAGDLVKRLECGLAIPYGSEALAKAVISLLREPERYRALREGGLRNGRRMTWTSLLNEEVSLIVPKLAGAGS